MISSVLVFTTWGTVVKASFEVVSVIFRSGTVASVLYLGIGAGTVTPGVSGRNIALVASIWRTRPWFIVVASWSHIVWVVLMYVVMLGLIYHGVGAGTVPLGVSGRNIALVVSIW